MTALLSHLSLEFTCFVPTSQAQGKLAEAEPYYQRSLAIREKSLGPDHPDVAESLNNLAQLLQVHGLSSAL